MIENLNELREKFVRKHFRQKYSNPDPEAWLAGQRTAEQPDLEQWDAFLLPDQPLINAAPDLIPTLRRYARPSFGVIPGDFKEEAACRQYIRPILENLDLTQVEVYYPEVWGPILVHKSGAWAFAFSRDYDLKKRPVVTLGPVSPMGVADAILASWHRGTQNASEARAFICDKVARAIQNLREMEEVEFNNAVAVSPDGEKIVHADSVVVVRYGKSWIAYENPSYFRDRKIIRTANFRRVAVAPFAPGNSALRRRFADQIEGMKPVLRLEDYRGPFQGFQVLCEFKESGKKVLAVSEDLCPPLPAIGLQQFLV